MRPIKICEKNKEKIEAALAAVNGKAYNHSITNYTEIQSILTKTENRLFVIQSVKKHWDGIEVWATGGRHVANAYKYTRQSTEICLERSSGSWKLTAINKCKLFSNQGGKVEIFLSKEAEERAKETFSRLYKRIREPVVTTWEKVGV